MQRIATQLLALSPELVEPIIADLPLHKALELLSVPFESSPVQKSVSVTGQLSPLAYAFIQSPAWRHVFTSEERTERLLLIWEASKSFFLLQTGRSYMHLLKSQEYGWRRSELLRAGADQLQGPEVLDQMSEGLFNLVPGLDVGHKEARRIAPSNAYMKAVFALLRDPKEVYQFDHEQDEVHVNASFGKTYDIRGGEWDPKDFLAIAKPLYEAWNLLKSLWATELESLAILYERFPTMLKAAFAPQLAHTPLNDRHMPKKLRYVAKQIPDRCLRDAIGSRKSGSNSTYFSFSHHYLLPYDWCLRLFVSVLQEKTPEIPRKLAADVDRATAGLDFIHEHSGDGKQYPRFKGSKDDARHMELIVYYDQDTVRPTPIAELDWLTSFLSVVKWMTEEYPVLADDLRQPVARIYRVAKGRGQKKLLLEPSDYDRFADAIPAAEVAIYLKKDLNLASRPLGAQDDHCLPSLLAFHMPDFSSRQAQQIAAHLGPKPGLAIELQQVVYENTLEKIQRHFQKRPPSPAEVSDGELLVHQILGNNNRGSALHTAQTSPGTWWSSVVKRYVDVVPRKPRSLSCYICRHSMSDKRGFHPIFLAMCKACGDFNLAGSRMSLPEMLDLRGKTALVTGGRVNLGFYTALRLLRCGAKVIVSSRYPRDTLVRYQRQPDCGSWIENRLRIVGADFRTARDAFALAAEVRNILVTWSTGDSTKPLLDILINNAAQTLTDGEAKEMTAVKRESNLHLSLPAYTALPETSYTPRIGGGAPEGFLEGRTHQALHSANTSTSVIQPVPEKSSWAQDMSEIPYADIITAQAVNAFVPLILIRELLPVMSHSEIREQQSGHIINVSSREGIFEASRNHSAKKGTHVHTNMSKAALNMITETEAGPAWRSHGVAMNTVDPGYMSASPEMESLFGGVRPLSWEDGAGRVLWPVAMAFGEEKTVIWGRFLKHYGTVSVTAGLR
ncbi:unnamed protein product [Clonostachys rhizophaga]|uniref:Uncharacterized protein n=1 Tax=Clonostachys rhizophaga TaxID=160324 RepID=A0A9N9VH73_9HYPO|nr:unnamed protein product [Clonostachys rhizophaga]